MTGPELRYSDDSKLLIRTFTGSVSFDDVMESWRWIIRNDMIGDELLGILNDFTRADLKMDPGKLDLLMGFFLEYPEIFKRIKLAVVMTLPENIVLPMLANKKYPQFKIRAFSTIPAARAWLRRVS